MKRNNYFVNVLLIFLLWSVNSFGQHIDAGPNQYLCLNETQAHLQAKLGAAYTQHYAVSAIPFEWDNDFSTAHDIMYSGNGQPEPMREDDHYSDAIDLPFDFYFFGKKYTKLVVGSNGDLVFKAEVADSRDEWEIQPYQEIPNQELPYWDDANQISYASIMGAYHDIDISEPSQNLAFKYKITGTAPNRKVIVIYQEIPQYSCTNLLTSQEIVLNEADYSIEVHIKEKPICNDWPPTFFGDVPGSAVLGIQNDALAPDTCGFYPGDGTSPSLPYRNTGVWEVTPANPEAYKFTPDGLIGVEWYDSNNQLVGTTPDIDVDLPADNSSATYTLKATLQDCQGNNYQETDNVTIFKLPDLQLDLPTQAFLCENQSITLNGRPANENDYRLIAYTWTDSNGQVISHDPQLEVNQPGQYTLEVNAMECVHDFVVDVQNYPGQCKIPEGISPNGDGKNDRWVLDFLADQVGIQKVEIFDRRGVKVYEKDDYVDQFAGKNKNGTDLPAAGYFYVIHLKDNRTLTGWLLIAR